MEVQLPSVAAEERLLELYAYLETFPHSGLIPAVRSEIDYLEQLLHKNK